jgi:hypothetical protein
VCGSRSGQGFDRCSLTIENMGRVYGRSQMHKGAMRAVMILMAMTVLTSCFVGGPGDPYAYSPTYCAGCWYGRWEGREGWHRGGGRPWEREHREGDHRGGGYRGEGDQHEGHR